MKGRGIVVLAPAHDIDILASTASHQRGLAAAWTETADRRAGREATLGAVEDLRDIIFEDGKGAHPEDAC